MSFLLIQPVVQHRNLTVEEIEITNRLYDLSQSVILQSQGARLPAEANRGGQSVAAFTGTFYDRLVKDRVREEIAKGELPGNLEVTPTAGDPGVTRFEARGPDFVRGTAAWDLTTGEAAYAHVQRDVIHGIDGLQVYFIIDY
ncbi:MAG: hypothetical protein HKN30_15270 [Sulfitobacter sp.]|nr:hypothetical protein [Sulfitobacter sp.]